MGVYREYVWTMVELVTGEFVINGATISSFTVLASVAHSSVGISQCVTTGFK